VTTRLVLDELDLDLSSLPTRLIIVIIIVVGSSGNARSLGATALSADAREVILRGGVVGGGINDVSHVGYRGRYYFLMRTFDRFEERVPDRVRGLM